MPAESNFFGKPVRYRRRGEARRRLQWSLFGLGLGTVLGLLLVAQTRRIVLGEAASLLPPRSPLTRFVDSGVKRTQEPDAMEKVAHALMLESGKYGDRSEREPFPQELELLALSERYPQRGDVQAAVLNEMNGFRLSSLQKKPGLPAPVLHPQLEAGFRRAAERGEIAEPDNGFFPLMKAALDFALGSESEGLQAVHRAALCSRWDAHKAERIEGQLAFRLREQGMVTPGEALLFRSDLLYTGVYSWHQVGEAVQKRAVAFESSGKYREGYAVRMNLVRITVNMDRSENDLSASFAPHILFLRGLTQPRPKTALQPNRPVNPASRNLREVDRIGDYCELLARHGLTRESQVVRRLKGNRLALDNAFALGEAVEGYVGVLIPWGAGLLMAALLAVMGMVFGAVSLRLHRTRFEGYRLPTLTPCTAGGLWVGLALSSLSLLGIYESEVPEMIFLLQGGASLAALGFARLLRSNREAASLLGAAGKVLGLTFGLLLFCSAICFSLNGWQLSSYLISGNANSVFSVHTAAALAGAVLGFFALLFLVCSVYAAAKRQPMGSGGLLHFGALGLSLIALVLLGYTGTVIRTAQRVQQNEMTLDLLIARRGH